MLTNTEGGAELVVCTTCRVAPDRQAGEPREDGRDGARMLDALRAALPSHPARSLGLALQPMPCLFACSNACTAYLRSAGRMGYLLGRFMPGEADATALLDYAAAYLRTAEGVVPYRQWPDGVKGHFITRLPPEGQVWRDAPDPEDTA